MRQLAALPSKAVKSHAIKGTQKLVLVDGVFAPQLSDIAALETGVAPVHTLRETLENESNPVPSRPVADEVGLGRE